MLKADHAIPLYVQLKEAILADITNGKFKRGAKIPTETELSELYQVSRITVRKAVSDLVDEGYLVKQQGKGTFVQAPKIDRKIEHLISFTAACEAHGLTSTSKIIKQEILKANDTCREMLHLEPDEKVIYIQRIRYAGESPLMLENNYYPYNRYHFLLGESLEGSLYNLLRDKYGIHPTKSGRTTLDIVLANDVQAKLLEVPIGKPLFLMDTIIYDQDGKPIHIGKQYIIGDRYQFTL